MNDHFAPPGSRGRGPLPDAFDFIGELRPDEDFDTPECNIRQPFDADRVDGIVCHIVAGSAVPVDAEMLRGGLRAGRFPTPAHDDAVMGALTELSTPFLRDVIVHCGASVREVASFVRRLGPRHMETVWCLNSFSRTGNDPIPRAIEKQLLAGRIEWLQQ